MSNDGRRAIESGVPNLDVVLGGGIPERDLLLVVGAPGSGKTTLVFQVAFHAASAGRCVVYVSTLTEPASRLLNHLRTFSYCDERFIGKLVFLESIYPVVKAGVEHLASALIETVRAHEAQLLILDGFTTIRELHPNSVELRTFVNDLAVALAPLGCTTIMTSSQIPDMRGTTPLEFTMCDGIIELGQHDVGARAVRRLRVWKMRGAPCLLGDHTMRLTGDGVAVFQRSETRAIPNVASVPPERMSIGIPELDQMMAGGLPRGSVTIVAGAPGTGKTLLALQYLVEGARHGQPGLLVGFRESAQQLVRKARSFDLDLQTPLENGLITIQRFVPVDHDIDEVLAQLWTAVDRTGAIRLAVDSMGELEAAILDDRRRQGIMGSFTEALRARGMTAILPREMGQIVGPELDFANSPLEVLGENVILLRYVELESQLARIVSILKMRDTDHDHSIRQYVIDAQGLRVLSPVESAEGLLSGIARLGSERRVKRHESPGGREGATDR